MGRTSDASDARLDSGCARCHTSWGALARPAPPREVRELGLTCVTCHDVHPHGTQAGLETTAERPPQPGLLRYFPLPATLPSVPPSYLGVSRVCVGCHAPSSNTARPEASAAAIVAGLGGLQPETGAALAMLAPHATDPKGCLSCHDSGPEQVTLGRSHSFRATEQVCQRCHGSSKTRDASIAKRAQRLLERLDPQHSQNRPEQPWHARKDELPPAPQQARALRNVLLVLEDPAADVHHPRYATALLDAAERLAPGVSQ